MLIFGREENPEKNPRNTGEINYDNSIHVSPKFEIQHRWSPIQLLTHPATDPVWPGLTWSLVVKGNTLTVYAIHASRAFMHFISIYAFFQFSPMIKKSIKIPRHHAIFSVAFCQNLWNNNWTLCIRYASITFEYLYFYLETCLDDPAYPDQQITFYQTCPQKVKVSRFYRTVQYSTLFYFLIFYLWF